jgi:hypothetical protein
MQHGPVPEAHILAQNHLLLLLRDNLAQIILADLSSTPYTRSPLTLLLLSTFCRPLVPGYVYPLTQKQLPLLQQIPYLHGCFLS